MEIENKLIQNMRLVTVMLQIELTAQKKIRKKYFLKNILMWVCISFQHNFGIRHFFTLFLFYKWRLQFSVNFVYLLLTNRTASFVCFTTFQGKFI